MTWKAILWGAVEAYRLRSENYLMRQLLRANEHYVRATNEYYEAERVGVSNERITQLLRERSEARSIRDLLLTRAFPNSKRD